MRWEELSWDKVRRAQMRWSVGCEECSVKCGAWRVQCEVWSVKFGVSRKQWEVRSGEVWTVKCEVWSAESAVWSVDCEVWSVKCEVWSLKSTVWSEVLTAKGAVWRVQCEECSVKCVVWSVKTVKCEVWSGASNVTCENKTPVSQSARTHGLGWRTAHASSIDEKGYLIYIFKATSAPPRAGTTGRSNNLQLKGWLCTIIIV